MTTRLFILVFLSFLTYSCSKRVNLDIGSKLRFPINSEKYVLTPNGSLVFSIDTIKNGIAYTLGIDKGGNVIFVSTIDAKIKINGKMIGKSIGIISSKIEYVKGWGYYVKLSNDWYAGFNYENKPTPNKKIQWFFKYKFAN